MPFLYGFNFQDEGPQVTLVHDDTLKEEDYALLTVLVEDSSGTQSIVFHLDGEEVERIEGVNQAGFWFDVPMNVDNVSVVITVTNKNGKQQRVEKLIPVTSDSHKGPTRTCSIVLDEVDSQWHANEEKTITGKVEPVNARLVYGQTVVPVDEYGNFSVLVKTTQMAELKADAMGWQPFTLKQDFMYDHNNPRVKVILNLITPFDRTVLPSAELLARPLEADNLVDQLLENFSRFKFQDVSKPEETRTIHLDEESPKVLPAMLYQINASDRESKTLRYFLNNKPLNEKKGIIYDLKIGVNVLRFTVKDEAGRSTHVTRNIILRVPHKVEFQRPRFAYVDEKFEVSYTTTAPHLQEKAEVTFENQTKELTPENPIATFMAPSKTYFAHIAFRYTDIYGVTLSEEKIVTISERVTVTGRVLDARSLYPVNQFPLSISTTNGLVNVSTDANGVFTYKGDSVPYSLTTKSPDHLEVYREVPLRGLNFWRVKDIHATPTPKDPNVIHPIDIQALPLRAPAGFFVEKAYTMVNNRPETFFIDMTDFQDEQVNKYFHILLQVGSNWFIHQKNPTYSNGQLEIKGRTGNYLIISRSFPEFSGNQFQSQTSLGKDIGFSAQFALPQSAPLAIPMKAYFKKPAVTCININEVVSVGQGAKRSIAYTRDFFGLQSRPIFRLNPVFKGETGLITLKSITPHTQPISGLQIHIPLEYLTLDIAVHNSPSPIIECRLLDKPIPPLPEGTFLKCVFSLNSDGIFPGDLSLTLDRSLLPTGTNMSPSTPDAPENHEVQAVLLRINDYASWEYVGSLKGLEKLWGTFPQERIYDKGIYAIIQIPKSFEEIKGTVLLGEEPVSGAQIFIENFPWHTSTAINGTFLLPVDPSSNQKVRVKYRNHTSTHRLTSNELTIQLYKVKIQL